MALASEGGSMGMWQNGLGPTAGPYSHSVPILLKIWQSSEHPHVIGVSISILTEAALEIGEVLGVTLLTRSKAGQMSANLARGFLGPFSTSVLLSQDSFSWILECYARGSLPFPETLAAR